MGSEKIAAATEAWNAMALQAMLENQKLAFSMMESFWSILGKGMVPVSRRASANAKRLGRPKRRRG